MRTQPKVVVITGAAGGLGRALVHEFLSDEWFVFAGSRGGRFDPVERLSSIEMDVTNPMTVSRAIEEIAAHQGRLDCLINNAGLTSDALLPHLSEADWQRVIDVNLTGAFRCSRAIAQQMIEQHDGHIINVSSFAGRAGATGQASYAAAKAGLLGLTQSLARELGPHNVRVNAILPGLLPTRMTASLTSERMQAYAAANALGRINSLDEVARFIRFLAGTRNISGQMFQLDSRIAPWT